MLALLTGTLESLDGTTAVVTPDGQPGLGYEVLLPAFLADRLRARGDAVGQPLRLFTLQYLEGVNQGSSFIPRLIGFASTHEREFFDLLTSVKGLGNKRALRAMAVEPSSIARAIAERNSAFLKSLPEIGPKLAELIVHELKNKADRFVLSPAATAALNAAATGSASGSATGSASGSAATTVEAKLTKPRKVAGAANGAGSGAATGGPTSGASPPVPIRQTIDALMALGETPLDAERMVSRAIDNARAQGQAIPTRTEELLTLAFSTR